MDNSQLRLIYGEGFITRFPDGPTVPWKPLSIEQFLYYEDQFRLGEVANSVLEDEIFKLCVTDQLLLQKLHVLPAGIVSTVANDIFLVSGPQNVDEANMALGALRAKYNSNPLYAMATTILWAFPGYKLTEVLGLPYEQFTMLVIAAEDLLMRKQVLSEPLSLTIEGQDASKKKKPVPREIREAWERGQKAMETPVQSKPVDSEVKSIETKIRKGAESPALDTQGKIIKQKSILKEGLADNREMGHRPNEEGSMQQRAKMIDDAAIIYADLLKHAEQMKKK